MFGCVCPSLRINVSCRDSRHAQFLYALQIKNAPTSKIHSFLSLRTQIRTKRKWFLFGTWTQVCVIVCCLADWSPCLCSVLVKTTQTEHFFPIEFVCEFEFAWVFLGLDTKYTPIRQISHSVPYNFQNFNYCHSKSTWFAWTVFSSIYLFFIFFLFLYCLIPLFKCLTRMINSLWIWARGRLVRLWFSLSFFLYWSSQHVHSIYIFLTICQRWAHDRRFFSE